mgnify:CR=1 FL=1
MASELSISFNAFTALTQLPESVFNVVAEYAGEMTIEDLFVDWKKRDPQWVLPANDTEGKLVNGFMLPSIEIKQEEFTLLARECTHLQLLFLNPHMQRIRIDGFNQEIVSLVRNAESVDNLVYSFLQQVFSKHASIHIELTHRVAVHFATAASQSYVAMLITDLSPEVRIIEGSSEVLKSEACKRGTEAFYSLKMTAQFYTLQISPRREIRRYNPGYL